MSTLPQTEPWFRTVFAFVKKRHDGKTDELGRPYYQHFERVANRLVMRFPGASPAQVQAALLHDAFEPGGTEPAALRANGASDEAIRIIERITLPTDGRDYLTYINDLVATGDMASIEVKLADNLDAIDLFGALGTPEARELLETRYRPVRSILEEAVAGRR